MPLTVTINHIVSLSPALEALIMAKIDDLNAKLDALDAALAAEKTQDEAKTAEIAALRAQVDASLSADQADALEARIQALLDKAPDVVTPDAPAPDPNAPAA